MKIPFTKAHGAKNDFLLTWAQDAPHVILSDVAIAICDRHTGAGADGWLVVSPGSGGAHGEIRLFNTDGSEPEISGNGTRCAAAFLIDAGLAGEDVRIRTGAGVKHLRLIERHEREFLFEMNMGKPVIDGSALRFELALKHGGREVAILNVGNPQCAVFVHDLDFDWRSLGAEIEPHRHFPKKTNVSFVKVVDEHTIDVRFYERGVGETMSSGTGSTGAAVAAIARGEVKSPVKVITPAGEMNLHWQGEDAYLIGPAEIVAKGEFFL